MANFYLKSGSALELSNRTWSTGERMVPLRSDVSTNRAYAKRWVWECTTGGTSNGTPTWPSSATADTTTVTQNGVVWTCRTPGYSSGSTQDWTFAAIYMDYVVPGLAESDTLYVSHQHSEMCSTAVSLDNTAATHATPIKVLCVNDGAEPPTTLATTAVVATATSVSIYITLSAYIYGVQFIAGAGTSAAANILLKNVAVNTSTDYENCFFHINNTNATSKITLGTSGSGASVHLSEFFSCTFRFGHISQTFTTGFGEVLFKGGSIVSGSSAITNLFGSVTLNPNLTMIGFDLSNAAAGVFLMAASMANAGKLHFIGCKLPNSWTGAVSGGSLTGPSPSLALFNPDDTQIMTSAGAVRSDTGVYRTSPRSWKITTTSLARFEMPLDEIPEIAIWNTTTGSALTATVEFIVDGGGTALKQGEIWLEISYLGTAGSPIRSFADNKGVTLLNLASASDLTSSSVTWTGATTPTKQKLTVTFTPQVAGFVIGKVFVGKASISANPVYVCPAMSLA